MWCPPAESYGPGRTAGLGRGPGIGQCGPRDVSLEWRGLRSWGGSGGGRDDLAEAESPGRVVPTRALCVLRILPGARASRVLHQRAGFEDPWDGKPHRLTVARRPLCQQRA